MERERYSQGEQTGDVSLLKARLVLFAVFLAFSSITVSTRNNGAILLIVPTVNAIGVPTQVTDREHFFANSILVSFGDLGESPFSCPFGRFFEHL